MQVPTLQSTFVDAQPYYPIGILQVSFEKGDTRSKESGLNEGQSQAPREQRRRRSSPSDDAQDAPRHDLSQTERRNESKIRRESEVVIIW